MSILLLFWAEELPSLGLSCLVVFRVVLFIDVLIDFDLQTTQMANKDLDKYYNALDKYGCLLRYC